MSDTERERVGGPSAWKAARDFKAHIRRVVQVRSLCGYYSCAAWPV